MNFDTNKTDTIPEKKVDIAPESKEDLETKANLDELHNEVLDDVVSRYTLLIWKEHKEKTWNEATIVDIAKNIEWSAAFNWIVKLSFIFNLADKIISPFKKIKNSLPSFLSSWEETETSLDLSISQSMFKRWLLKILKMPDLAPKIIDQMNVVLEVREDLKLFSQELSQNIDITKLNNKVSDLDAKLSETTPITKQDNNVDVTSTVAAAWAVTLASDVEQKDKDSREKVLEARDFILELDEWNPIDYDFGGKEIKDGIDCSWFINVIANKAWLDKIWADSRDMFKKNEIHKLSENGSYLTDLDKTPQPGDLLFWDSTDPDYQRKTANIPEIKKDNTDYKIHHVAMVDEYNPDTWKLVISESNGSQWVSKREVDISKEFTKKHKSNLYFASMDYSKYEKSA